MIDPIVENHDIIRLDYPEYWIEYNQTNDSWVAVNKADDEEYIILENVTNEIYFLENVNLFGYKILTPEEFFDIKIYSLSFK